MVSLFLKCSFLAASLLPSFSVGQSNEIPVPAKATNDPSKETPEGLRSPESKASPDSQSTEDGTTTPLSPFLAIPLAPVALVAPGSMHYFRGDQETSESLYQYGGNSFLVLLSSGLILAASGAADQTILPFLPLAVGGAAGWLAFASMDLIGSTLDKSNPEAYSSPWDKTYEAGVDYIRVKSPIFQNYFYRGIHLRFLQNNNYLRLRTLESNEGGIRIHELDYGRRLVSRDQKSQGLYAHLQIREEKNPIGFFRMSTFEPSLGLLTDGSLFAPGLERIYLNTRFGLQKHVVQYQFGTGGQLETDSSMFAHFETTWSATSWLRPGVGYSHERDSLLASQNTAFTGVFYMTAAMRLCDQYLLKARSYLSQDETWDLQLSAAF